MIQYILGFALVAHGWAHVWYIILSEKIFEIKEEVAWTGKSWILSNIISESVTTKIATIGYFASLVGFLAGGMAYASGQGWWRIWVLTSAIVSSFTIFTFWDGVPVNLFDKGLIGLVINIVILGFLLK